MAKKNWGRFKSQLPDVWGGGQILAFSGIDGPTDFENGLCFRTLNDCTGLELLLPATTRIVFSQYPPQEVVLTGDVVYTTVENRIIRGAFVDALHFLIEGKCTVVDKSEKIVVKQKDNRTLIGVKGFFIPAKIDVDLDLCIDSRLNWLASLKIPSSLSLRKRKILMKALSIMKTQVYTPSGWIKHRWTTPDRWPHRRMWLWDSAFHAIGWRHIDIDIARESIESVFDTQCEDGKIACTCGPDFKTEESQPPVLGMAAYAVYNVDQDKEWLKEIYPKLCRYIRWDLKNRSSVSGLLGWFIRKDSTFCRCGESGMDNSSRFDTDAFLEAVDFNSYIALECDILSKIAMKIGKNEESDYWANQHKKFLRLINKRLWDEKRGIYMDCDAETGVKTEILSSAGFLPLICGAPSISHAERMAQHIYPPGYFASKLPVASISPTQSEFYSKDTWRGPVWININWLIAEGFIRYGLEDTAMLIIKKTISQIEHYYEKYGTFFEFYDDSLEVEPLDLPRKGKNEHGSPYNQVIHDYGWTTTLYVDWLFRGNF